MQREFLPLIVLLGSVVAISAASAPLPQGTGAVRDSAGIRIVTNPAAPTSAVRIDTQPVFRVGFRDGDYLFETINGATFLSDGSAVVANTGGVQELAVFSPSGSLARKLGRKGQGPGEFQAVRDPIVIGSDTILATDSRSLKHVLYHGARLLRDVSLGPEGNLQPLGMSAPGKLMLGPWLGVIFGRLFPTPWNRVPLVVMDMKTNKADTVGTTDQEQSLNFGGRNPFKSQGVAVVSQGMFVTGRTDAPELRFTDATGKLRQIARWQATKTAVHDTIWRNYSTRYGKFLREREGPVMPEEYYDGFVGQRARDAIKEPMPLFGGLQSSPDGNLWIADYAPRYNGDPPQSMSVTRHFRLMAPNGQWIADVRIPNTAHFREYYRRVLAVGKDRILTLEVDSLGTNGVAVYRILR